MPIKKFTIQQPDKRFLYGAIMAPVAAIGFLISVVAVSVSTKMYFVFGFLGGLSCLAFSFYLLRVFKANLLEYKMVIKSNPISVIVENKTLKAYKTTKLDSFDFNQPISIQLNSAKKTDVKGGINKIIRIQDELHKVEFNNSMKFIDGSFESLKNEIFTIID